MRSHCAPRSSDFHRKDTPLEKPMIDEPYRPPSGSALMMGSPPSRWGSTTTECVKVMGGGATAPTGAGAASATALARTVLPVVSSALRRRFTGRPPRLGGMEVQRRGGRQPHLAVSTGLGE